MDDWKFLTVNELLEDLNSIELDENMPFTQIMEALPVEEAKKVQLHELKFYTKQREILIQDIHRTLVDAITAEQKIALLWSFFHHIACKENTYLPNLHEAMVSFVTEFTKQPPVEKNFPLPPLPSKAVHHETFLADLQAIDKIFFYSAIAWNSLQMKPSAAQILKDYRRDELIVNGSIFHCASSFPLAVASIVASICDNQMMSFDGVDDTAIASYLIPILAAVILLLHVASRTVSGGVCFETAMELISNDVFCLLVPLSAKAKPVSLGVSSQCMFFHSALPYTVVEQNSNSAPGEKEGTEILSTAWGRLENARFPRCTLGRVISEEVTPFLLGLCEDEGLGEDSGAFSELDLNYGSYRFWYEGLKRAASLGGETLEMMCRELSKNYISNGDVSVETFDIYLSLTKH